MHESESVNELISTGEYSASMVRLKQSKVTRSSSTDFNSLAKQSMFQILLAHNGCYYG